MSKNKNTDTKLNIMRQKMLDETWARWFARDTSIPTSMLVHIIMTYAPPLKEKE